MLSRAIWAPVIFLALFPGISSNSVKAEGAASTFKRCAIRSFKDARQGSAAVFLGKVTKAETKGDVEIVHFQVEKYWKGTVKKKAKVKVYESMRFQSPYTVGVKYLVYATKDNEGNLTDFRCSRSNDVANASSDLKQLGKAKRPR